MNAWTLNEGDCLDPVTGLASLPDRSVDHFISDPPFSRDLYAATRTNRGSGIRKNGHPYAENLENPRRSAMQLASNAIGAAEDILEPAAVQMLRLARRWIIVFHDVEIGHLWKAAFGEAYVRTGIWVKTDPMPQVSGDRPAQGFEAITIAHALVGKRAGSRGRMRWNGGGRAAVWTFGTCRGRERPDHPCPKPLRLVHQLVLDFTEPGELVCDPFAGSGTTGHACLITAPARRFVGWERDPAFAAVARKRLSVFPVDLPTAAA